MGMSSSDYSKYKSAVQQANSEGDKDALKRIQKQLIAEYGLGDKDVDYLLKMFRYSV